MGSRTISVLCLVLTAAQIAFGEVWEFGKINTPGSLGVVHKEGHMGLFEHNKKVQLVVPQCYVLTYVRVNIKNLISTPEVQFNVKTNVVSIHYAAFSSSLSSYEITGKAVWIPGCQRDPGRQFNG